VNPEEIADLSLASARQGFEEAVQALVDAAEGDRQVLLAASRIVAQQQVAAEGPEHIAFTYLTAAYRQLTGT
jgi:ribosomal protein S2